MLWCWRIGQEFYKVNENSMHKLRCFEAFIDFPLFSIFLVNRATRMVSTWWWMKPSQIRKLIWGMAPNRVVNCSISSRFFGFLQLILIASRVFGVDVSNVLVRIVTFVIISVMLLCSAFTHSSTLWSFKFSIQIPFYANIKHPSFRQYIHQCGP